MADTKVRKMTNRQEFFAGHYLATKIGRGTLCMTQEWHSRPRQSQTVPVHTV